MFCPHNSYVYDSFLSAINSGLFAFIYVHSSFFSEDPSVFVIGIINNSSIYEIIDNIPHSISFRECSVINSIAHNASIDDLSDSSTFLNLNKSISQEFFNRVTLEDLTKQNLIGIPENQDYTIEKIQTEQTSFISNEDTLSEIYNNL